MEHLSISDIEAKLTNLNQIPADVRAQLENDPRKGIHLLLRRWDRKREQRREMIAKYAEMSRYEQQLYQSGKKYIAGIDEAGRGPLAGPVVAACVILKQDAVLYGINDSKQLSRKKREAFFKDIYEQAFAVGVGIVSAKVIDEINIYQASKRAMVAAVRELRLRPDHLLIDAMTLPVDISQTSLIKGDARSISIAAASIIAKVTRDKIMDGLDEQYPGYAFSSHMGYGTKVHLEAIEKLGPCPEHRLSFAPLSKRNDD